MRKIVLSIGVIITMIGLFLLIIDFSPYDDSDAEGTITIIVVDINGHRVIEDTHAFTDEDTLFDILSNHYNIDYRSMRVPYYQDGKITQSMSRAILSIGTVETDFEQSFLKIYLHTPIVDDEDHIIDYDVRVSHVGVDHLPLKDAFVYEFRVEGVWGGGS